MLADRSPLTPRAQSEVVATQRRQQRGSSSQSTGSGRRWNPFWRLGRRKNRKGGTETPLNTFPTIHEEDEDTHLLEHDDALTPIPPEPNKPDIATSPAPPSGASLSQSSVTSGGSVNSTSSRRSLRLPSFFIKDKVPTIALSRVASNASTGSAQHSSSGISALTVDANPSPLDDTNDYDEDKHDDNTTIATGYRSAHSAASSSYQSRFQNQREDENGSLAGETATSGASVPSIFLRSSLDSEFTVRSESTSGIFFLPIIKSTSQHQDHHSADEKGQGDELGIAAERDPKREAELRVETEVQLVGSQIADMDGDGTDAGQSYYSFRRSPSDMDCSTLANQSYYSFRQNRSDGEASVEEVSLVKITTEEVSVARTRESARSKRDGSSSGVRDSCSLLSGASSRASRRNASASVGHSTIKRKASANATIGSAADEGGAIGRQSLPVPRMISLDPHQMFDPNEAQALPMSASWDPDGGPGSFLWIVESTPSSLKDERDYQGPTAIQGDKLDDRAEADIIGKTPRRESLDSLGKFLAKDEESTAAETEESLDAALREVSTQNDINIQASDDEITSHANLTIDGIRPADTTSEPWFSMAGLTKETYYDEINSDANLISAGIRPADTTSEPWLSMVGFTKAAYDDEINSDANLTSAGIRPADTTSEPWFSMMGLTKAASDLELTTGHHRGDGDMAPVLGHQGSFAEEVLVPVRKVRSLGITKAKLLELPDGEHGLQSDEGPQRPQAIEGKETASIDPPLCKDPSSERMDQQTSTRDGIIRTLNDEAAVESIALEALQQQSPQSLARNRLRSSNLMDSNKTKDEIIMVQGESELQCPTRHDVCDEIDVVPEKTGEGSFGMTSTGNTTMTVAEAENDTFLVDSFESDTLEDMMNLGSEQEFSTEPLAKGKSAQRSKSDLDAALGVSTTSIWSVLNLLSPRRGGSTDHREDVADKTESALRSLGRKFSVLDHSESSSCESSYFAPAVSTIVEEDSRDITEEEGEEASTRTCSSVGTGIESEFMDGSSWSYSEATLRDSEAILYLLPTLEVETALSGEGHEVIVSPKSPSLQWKPRQDGSYWSRATRSLNKEWTELGRDLRHMGDTFWTAATDIGERGPLGLCGASFDEDNSDQSSLNSLMNET